MFQSCGDGSSLVEPVPGLTLPLAIVAICYKNSRVATNMLFV